MNERKRPTRKGRTRSPQTPDDAGDDNPYRDAPESSASSAPPIATQPPPPPIERPRSEPIPPSSFESALERLSGERSERSHAESVERFDRVERPDRPERVTGDRLPHGERVAPGERPPQGERPARGDRPPRRDRPPRGERPDRGPRPDRDPRSDRDPASGDPNARRNGRRGRNRFRRGGVPSAAPSGSPATESPTDRLPGVPVIADGMMVGWFDSARDGGFLRRPENSYLPDPADPFVPPALVRLHQLRRGDKLDVSYGRDPRGRLVVIEVLTLNDGSAVVLEKRPDFNTLTASYPDRKLTLETGRPAKTGPELTRRAIDLIAPIGYGQRALIVAPARAGKTTLLQAIVEGVAINHPEAALIVLLVDERPEEVSEMITWGYGEVVASSFDMPSKRHVEVADMALERARRLVEMGKDVVIVLDSITRLARAHNTTDRGTGRTMSGGLDATAMQKPKAFFGSARMIAPAHGGGSLTIIATALVETGSRMDDVIFEEFKGTGNCEIKLDRSLADRRIFPAFDIGTSGTRREEKLYRPDQLEKVHLLRRGLHQLPPQAGMEWLIKRIAGTSNNDSLLDGL